MFMQNTVLSRKWVPYFALFGFLQPISQVLAKHPDRCCTESAPHTRSEETDSETLGKLAQNNAHTERPIQRKTREAKPLAFVINSNEEQPVFCALPSATLKGTLAEWCQNQNWQLIWDSAYDYPILAEIKLQGSVVDVIKQLISSYRNAVAPLRVDVYPAQHLVVISNA